MVSEINYNKQYIVDGKIMYLLANLLSNYKEKYSQEDITLNPTQTLSIILQQLSTISFTLFDESHNNWCALNKKFKDISKANEELAKLELQTTIKEMQNDR